MPVVGLAEVLVQPVFTGTQSEISRRIEPAAKRAGRDAGRTIGSSMADGLASETPKLKAEVTKLGAAVAEAENKVTASRQKAKAAADAEAKALGNVRVAQAKLDEVYKSSTRSQSQLTAAVERHNVAQRAAERAAEANAAAIDDLAGATDKLGKVEMESAQATKRLSTHMADLDRETEKSSRGIGRLGAAMRNAFRGRPLGEVVRNVGVDSNRIARDIDRMSNRVGESGTRGGRAFTRAFLIVGGVLTGIFSLAGAAGSSLIAAAGAVTTLASSLQQLGGIAALIPAGLVAVGAAAGTLRAAFSGMGNALKTAIEAPDKLTKAAANPRIMAMALEDAMGSIARAEERAARSRVDSARRVEDAQRALQDVIEDSARAQKAALKGVEQAERRVVEAAKRIVDAQRDLQDVMDSVAERREDASRSIEMAQRREASAARDVLEAQRDLNEARAEAVQRVRDVARELDDAQLKAKETQLAYNIAAQNYQKGADDPASSQNRINMLEMAMLKAQAANEDAKTAVQDLTKEQVTAKREAETANEAIMDAEQRLADARQAQADAIYERKEAQEDAVRSEKEGARAIADAQEGILKAMQDQTDALDERREAQEAVVQAEKDGARAILDAQRNIADAQQESRDAQVDAQRAVQEAYRNLEQMQLQQAESARNAGEDSAIAMGKLTPAAQQAAQALLDVYKRLQGVRDIAQENFFKGFAAPLYALADTVIPQLEIGVGRIATALGAGAQQAMNSLNGALDDGVLESLLTSVADSITILNGAIDPLVQSFVTLALIGMPYMEDLATSIRDASIEFNTFIQGAAADGSLNKWIDDGIQGFKDLISIAGSIGGIFSAWNDAARAGGIDLTLARLAGWLGSIEERMKGEVFQTTMSTIFTGAAGGAKGLADGLGMINQAFVTGAPALSDFLRLGGEITGLFLGGLATALSNPEFGAGLTSFLENVKLGAEEMMPLLPGLFEAFGELLTVIGPLARELGPTLIRVFTFFAETLTNVMTFLEPLLEMLVGSEAIIGAVIGAFVLTAGVSAALTAAFNVVTIGGWALRGAFRGISLIGKIVAGTFGFLLKAGLFLGKMGLAVLTGIVKGAAVALRVLWTVMRANPIGFIITIVGLVVAALIWFFTETEIGRKIVQKAWKWIQEAVANVAAWFINEALPKINRFIALFGEGFERLKIKYVDPVVKWIRNTIRDAALYLLERRADFTRFVNGVGEAFDKLREKAKKPINFVITKVINEGLIGGLNNIPGVNIKPIKWPPKGWRKGGYTGDGNPDEWAGGVHKKEFVFNEAATSALGKENLAAMMWSATHNKSAANVVRHDGGGARSTPGFSPFWGNVNQIKPHGAYHMRVAAGMEPWNFTGAARLWNGAAGLKVKTGIGAHQGYVTERDRGGGILGYATGTNIDMSPAWKKILGPKQRLTVAAHEAGHAIGLPHDTGGKSIMAPLLHQMAATPTARDIQNLRFLYPGGSGKAGTAEPENPLAGLIGGLIKELRRAFPKGGMFMDVAIGIAQEAFRTATKWIEDIKKGIVNIASDVVNGVKDFFGIGSTIDRSRDNGVLVRDSGGIIPPGLSHIYNGTGQNEYAVTPEQMQLKRYADARVTGRGGDTYNVELPRGASVDDLIGAVDFEKRRVARGGARR